MGTQDLSQTAHLYRRNGIYYYRRRVPDALVAAIGKKEIHQSLKTTSLAEAKKLRAVEDLKWHARFEAAADASTAATPAALASQAIRILSEREVIRRVQVYVARSDECAKGRFMDDPPCNEAERADLCTDAEIGVGILENRDDPRADELVGEVGRNILTSAGGAIGGGLGVEVRAAELVRRGLLELERRRLARAQGDHQRDFYDSLFDPQLPPSVTFGEIADQFMAGIDEEANANGTSLKWVDKQRAHAGLLKEIVGGEAPIHTIDYDACLRVRSILARLPTNRTKLYEGLTLEQAISRAETEAKPLLSPVTQQGYLSTLREILGLATKKRLIPANPADGMKPLKKDGVTAEAKRRPFANKQLVQFFNSDFYRECAKHPVPYRHDKAGWRFWLPLMCLFMGMRPNEACQMDAGDVKRTELGTWYVDVVASGDDDDTSGGSKKLKTAHSRRRIPVHPELIAAGFLKFANDRKGGRLFPSLTPDEYGNRAKYALKRFRDTFLPAAMTIEAKQSFYSFRHNFRDALRAIGAPPDALQALGGWSQGKLVSDSYGEKSNPDYQAQFMQKIGFKGVKLNILYPK